MSNGAEWPVVVVGAGPVGLAAAAHLFERGLTPLVLEAGSQAGGAVGAVGARAAVLPLGRTGRPGRREAAGADRLDHAGRRPRTRPAATGPSSTCSRWPTSSASGCASAPP